MGTMKEAQEVPPGETRWMGRWRPSMAVDPLLAHAELGKPRKTTFANPEPGRVFGIKPTPDAEGARAVTMKWKEHTPNPHTKPGPDFKAMNRLAVDSGLTSSKGVRAFRESHTVVLKRGAAVVSRRPALPSDKDTSFVYGKPPGYRSAEECRNCGPNDPPMRSLVQGAFSGTWVAMNAGRAAELDPNTSYIKPRGTAATRGHAAGSAAARGKASGGGSGGGWKMSKFLATPPRVTAYMGCGGGGGGDGDDYAEGEC